MQEGLGDVFFGRFDSTNLGLEATNESALAQNNAASNALNARLTTNTATHQANQAAAQQAGVTTIDTLLDNDYTAFLTAQFTGHQTAATNLLTETEDWGLDNIGSNVAYAAIAAVASNAYSSLRESTIFAHNLLAASSLKQAEAQVAGSYQSNGTQLADAIAAYQIAEAQALRDHRIAIEQADRRFADNGDTTAHNTSLTDANKALRAARETFTEAYYKAAIGAQGAHQSTVAKSEADYENNVGQSRAQSTKAIADAQVDYVTTEAAAYRTQQETIAARDKQFAEFDVDNDYDSLVDALAALTAANNDTADPWTTKALAIAAVVHDAATDIAAAIHDYDVSQAAASEANDVANAQADRDRTVGEVKADVGKVVTERDIVADRVAKEAAVHEQNANSTPITNAVTGNSDDSAGEGESAYANLPVKIPENLMRPTETILQPEEGEVTFAFTNPGPHYNLDPPLYHQPYVDRIPALTESEKSKGELALKIARDVFAARDNISDLARRIAVLENRLNSADGQRRNEAFREGLREQQAVLEREILQQSNNIKANLYLLATTYSDAVIPELSSNNPSEQGWLTRFYGGVGGQAALDRVLYERNFGSAPKMESVFVEDFLAVYFAGRSIAQAVMKSYVTVGIRGAATTGGKEVLKETADANSEQLFGFSPRTVVEGAAKGAARRYNGVDVNLSRLDAPTRNVSRYSRDVFEGRRIYRAADDFDLGVPTNVDPKYVHKSIRQKIENGWTNADLMRNGNAPIGRDGRPINLHHVLGDEPGPMLEILGSTHKRHHGPLHGLIEDGNSFRNVPGLESQYNSFRGRYWKWRIEQLTGN
ncbi:HNH/ENDO VII family nuclease [Blastopirellula marina]|uniref:LHH domain-containing protein n=1 Tax=Blastopirellula marina DSM 3645 TaxID=314230 RepID=A3ZX35_9BACT|nr:HNH/ENDO VII family nuclease [Blastopirellula marina]EAQ78912.1 hypothetical protein DSM3645_27568 [Blastopirellula marina DSM 3645]